MSRTLVTLGLILIVLGLLWPWLRRLHLFRLPGDIDIERDNFRFYFPVTSMLLISLLLTLLLWLLR